MPLQMADINVRPLGPVKPVLIVDRMVIFTDVLLLCTSMSTPPPPQPLVGGGRGKAVTGLGDVAPGLAHSAGAHHRWP